VLRFSLALGAAAVLFAQQPHDPGPLASVPLRVRVEARAAPSAFRVAVRQVVIPVTALDPFGNPVPGLPGRAFHLFEDGVEQRLTYFAAEDTPVSLGLIFDASGSMAKKIDDSREAVTRFLRAGAPGDEYFLIEFNDTPRLTCDFTSDPAEIEKHLPGIHPGGWTSLFDAVYLGVSRMRRSHNPRRALLVLSDGGDNRSRYSRGETMEMIKEADTAIYTIGLSASGLTTECTRLLKGLAEETGGQMFPVREVSDLPEAILKINEVLRNRYLLGYEPLNASDDGRYRNVSVKLDAQEGHPPLRLTWRPGYYAPGTR
jgi:Ca-activated chloride channel family protein